MEIAIIRHAESEYNRKKILQGRIDCDLSQNGLAATKKAAANFPQDFDVCYCSPLKRTRDTAKILVPNVPIIYDKLLIERDMGDWQDTPVTDEKTFMLNNDETPPNGESLDDLNKRVKKFLNKIKKTEKNKKIIVVAHAGIIYSVFKVLNLPEKEVNNLEIVRVKF